MESFRKPELPNGDLGMNLNHKIPVSYMNDSFKLIK